VSIVVEAEALMKLFGTTAAVEEVLKVREFRKLKEWVTEEV
jgi:hypothetical protein